MQLFSFFPLLRNIILVPYTGTGLFFVWVSRALILLTIFFWGPTTVTPTFFTSLEKKRRCTGWVSVLSLRFLGLMWANRNQLAHLILYCCAGGASRYGNTAETQTLVWKIARAIVWKQREAAKKSKNSFSLLVFAYLEEKQWNSVLQ